MRASITWLARARRGMRPSRLGAGLGAAALASALAGCRGNTVEALHSGLTLRTLPDCAPDRVERLVIEPLGYFALEQPIARDLSEDKLTLTGLPADSEWFRLRVETPDPNYRAYALGLAGSSGEVLDALVLPLTRTCHVRDGALSALTGTASALVAGDDLLQAGGFDRDDFATRATRLLRVAPAELDDGDELDVERGFATALALEHETWVIGGTFEQRAGAPAWDSFDRFDAESRSFVGLGRMRARRATPAALRLLDGSVLVAGGAPASGAAPLSSIESISADAASSELWSDELPFSAPSLALFARDNGRVVAVGLGDDGASGLAALDRATRSVEPLDLPSLAAGAGLLPELVTPLPGGRMALLEVDASKRTTGSMFVMLEDDRYLEIADPRASDAALTWLSSFAGVEKGRVLALPDGRVLLTGERQGVPLARLLDPGSRDVTTRALDAAIERLFLRADGSVLMDGPEGVRILREDARSAYDNPGGNLLADDSGALCLDAYGRFAREGLGLRATVRGARFDLVPLRYQDVRIELSVEGAAQLVFTRADGAERWIAVGGDDVGPAYCQLSAAPGDTITIERRDQRISLQVGKLSRDCQLDGMSGPIAVALRALEVDTFVRDLRATRL